MGAASIGGISTFHDRFRKFGYETEILRSAEDLHRIDPDSFAGLTIEPLIQGAAGMRLWPEGMLKELRKWCDSNDVFLIFDEVMTGFGRTGKMFACQREDVYPDLMALAKGLTGGYMPLAVTLATKRVYNAFLGEYEELRTFFYGHSYCGNPLGCAAAFSNLEVFEKEKTVEKVGAKSETLGALLENLRAEFPDNISSVRQCGLIAGIDIVASTSPLEVFDWKLKTGAKICNEARKHGLLTRPIQDTLVLMPPLSISDKELKLACAALGKAIKTII